MMTFLSILFLIASFPFQGIALAAKTASAVAKTNKIAIEPKIKSTTNKRKKLTRLTKRKKLKAKKSTELLDKLKNSKANTKKSSPLKHKRLNTKINKAKSQVAKDKASAKTSKAKEKATKTQERTLKTTKHSLQLTEITQNALHLAANGTAFLLKGISKIFSLLIPIDVYITLAVLVLVIVSAVVSVIYTNGGIADPNINSEQVAGKDDVYIDEEGNIVENPEFNEDGELVEKDPYKKVEDSGWIILSQQDERWGSTTVKSKDGEVKISDTSLGSFICCLSMIHTKLDGTSIITPDKVASSYNSLYDDYISSSVTFSVGSNDGSDETITSVASILRSYTTNLGFNLTINSITSGSNTIGEDFLNQILDEGYTILLPLIASESEAGINNLWANKTEGYSKPTYMLIYKYSDNIRVISPNANHEDITNTDDGDSSRKPYSTATFTVEDILPSLGYIIYFK